MSKGELKNSPLHGLSLEAMLNELVEFYGWKVLDAGIDLKCLRIHPTIESAMAFLKKTEWARNRVEDFYLYSYKQMPVGSREEMELKPRERGFSEGVQTKKPKLLTVKQAETEREKRVGKEEMQKRKRIVERERFDTPASRSESTFKSRFSKSPFRKD